MNRSSPPSELRAVFDALVPHARRAFGLSVGASLLVLAPTIYMFEVYERVVNSRSHTTLAMLTLVVLLAFVVMQVLEWARSATQREAAADLDRRLSDRVFDVVHDVRLKRPAEGGIQPMRDLQTLREFVLNPVVGAVMETPTALVFLVVLFLLHPLLGWISLAGAVVSLGVAWMNERSTVAPLFGANRALSGARHYADSAQRNAEVVRAMGMIDDVRRRWSAQQRQHLALQAQASDAGGIWQSSGKVVQNLLSSLLLGVGAWLVLRAELPGDGGAMIVASVLGGRMLAPLVQAVAQWRAVVNARGAWMRLEEALASSPARMPSMALPPAKGVLSVESVVAGAPGSPNPLIKGASFSLQPGEMLAVIGPSAAGKSSLGRVLVGLWATASGKVRLDGVDVHGWNKAELGPQIGYLPQDVALLDGTVAENIARFGDIDRDAVEAAARAVGLHEMIESLPQGYDTSVGPEGTLLSGGQRQRVGLARALYGTPRFVVLDEPNASLDEAGDAALLRAIAGHKAQGASIVVITQRAGVLAVADKVLVLRDGAQQAFGPRDQVLASMSRPAAAAASPAVVPVGAAAR